MGADNIVLRLNCPHTGTSSIFGGKVSYVPGAGLRMRTEFLLQSNHERARKDPYSVADDFKLLRDVICAYLEPEAGLV